MEIEELEKALRNNLDSLPFDVESIPTWIFDKFGKVNAGFCMLSALEGYIGIVHETDKAYLLEVENTFNTPKCSCWQFWVAKSLLTLR